MNTILNFIFDVVSIKSSTTTPVGLTSFRTEKEIEKHIEVKPKKTDIRLSDLMKRPH